MLLPPLNLLDGEVHLWLTFPQQIHQTDLIRQYHAIMNPEEKKQQARFHFEKHRHQYLLTRATIRTLLSRYHPTIPPEGWRFKKNEYGRPYLDHGDDTPQFLFNLTHTEGLIVCAIVKGREIGVDAEDIQRGGDLVPIADRFFSPSEVQDLHKLPESEHIERFFDYWTLKESYIKARGMGLSIPLEQFSFHFGGSPDIRVTVDPAQNDPPGKWQFRQWRIGDRYKIALCLEKITGQTPLVKIRELIPGSSDKDYDLETLRNGFE